MTDNSSKNIADRSSKDGGSELYPCVPSDWLWLPRPVRRACGHVLMVFFMLSFIVVPFTSLGIFVSVPLGYFGLVNTSLLTTFWSVWLGICALSYFYPQREWVAARSLGQLLYEVVDFRCNLSESERHARVEKAAIHGEKIIFGMHPHGIMPFHALLWAAYCDQYLSWEIPAEKLCDKSESRKDETHSSGSVFYRMYGFGASADVVLHLPFLRNLMGWLTAGGVSYKTLRDGIVDGKSLSANRCGRKPRNLYIFPGGIAEIAVSAPGREAVVVKNRKGLCRLSLETGAQLIPIYVFGVNDFYHNAAAAAKDKNHKTNAFVSALLKLSRKLRIGAAIFWGPYWWAPLLPYCPRLTMVLGEPIKTEKEDGEKLSVDEVHERYVTEMQLLFEKYKKPAGYGSVRLEVL